MHGLSKVTTVTLFPYAGIRRCALYSLWHKCHILDPAATAATAAHACMYYMMRHQLYYKADAHCCGWSAAAKPLRHMLASTVLQLTSQLMRSSTHSGDTWRGDRGTQWPKPAAEQAIQSCPMCSVEVSTTSVFKLPAKQSGAGHLTRLGS